MTPANAVSPGRFALSPGQLRTYEVNGHLTLRHLFRHDEIAPVADEAERLAARHDLIDANNLRCRYQPDQRGSAPNLTARWRRQLYLSYTAYRDGGNLREQHYRRFHAWLRQKYTAVGKANLYFR